MRIICNICQAILEDPEKKKLVRLLASHNVAKHGMKAGLIKIIEKDGKVNFKPLDVN